MYYENELNTMNGGSFTVSEDVNLKNIQILPIASGGCEFSFKMIDRREDVLSERIKIFLSDSDIELLASKSKTFASWRKALAS